MTDPQTNRLDVAVLAKLPDISRARAAKLIQAGEVSLNGQVVTKASTKVDSDDKISVNYDPTSIKIPKISLPIIFEDSDVVVINKPSGVLAHSKGSFNAEPTVASWLADKYSGELTNRSGIVHRLDRATSGVMIAAKNEPSSQWLQKQFSTRAVKKTYIAIVSGHLNYDEALIDLPIERSPAHPQTFRVGAGGKPSQTPYKVIDSNEHFSLIELKPTTGRTHQLRVHLAHLGHPIVGDELYKGVKADRLYLHALSLELTLPSKKRSTFESPLPKEFKLYMNNDRPAN